MLQKRNKKRVIYSGKKKLERKSLIVITSESILHKWTIGISWNIKICLFKLLTPKHIYRLFARLQVSLHKWLLFKSMGIQRKALNVKDSSHWLPSIIINKNLKEKRKRKRVFHLLDGLGTWGSLSFKDGFFHLEAVIYIYIYIYFLIFLLNASLQKSITKKYCNDSGKLSGLTAFAQLFTFNLYFPR